MHFFVFVSRCVRFVGFVFVYMSLFIEHESLESNKYILTFFYLSLLRYIDIIAAILSDSCHWLSCGGPEACANNVVKMFLIS